jgi:hypothetical protein
VLATFADVFFALAVVFVALIVVVLFAFTVTFVANKFVKDIVKVVSEKKTIVLHAFANDYKI